ncbi:hypothetical protein C8R45DRAFT_1177539 [Mycena sanguinolenta]|nr:hypothetical protein C8R45DRAFT_1177539 [Mycena sanguinolenta]
MDNQPNPNAEFIHSTTREPESASHASGMFSHSRQFTVAGGTFTNITKNYVAAPSLPSAIRISFRSVALQVQMTYMPRFSMMISYRFGKFWIVIEVLISRRYIFMRPAYVTFLSSALDFTCRKTQDLSDACDYICATFPLPLSLTDWTKWIRRSTGRLCIELTPPSDYLWLGWPPSEPPGLSRMDPFDAFEETITTCINWLTLKQYHRICDFTLAQSRSFNLSASTTMSPRAVFHCPSYPLEDSLEIAFLPSAEAPYLDDWTILRRGTREVMANGWTRYFFIGQWSFG